MTHPRVSHEEWLARFDEDEVMRVGYARVSTSDQRLDLQRDALLQSGCTKICAEVARGMTAERTALNAALE